MSGDWRSRADTDALLRPRGYSVVVGLTRFPFWTREYANVGPAWGEFAAEGAAGGREGGGRNKGKRRKGGNGVRKSAAPR